MADQPTEDPPVPQYDPRNNLKSPFPAPPPFWKHFTTTNLARLSELTTPNPSSTRPANLPYELAVLLPPPPPNFGSYTTFSALNQVHPGAEPPSREIMLFDITAPSFNPAVALMRLTKSLLLNFLELMTIMTDNPGERTEKVADIRRLIINVHAVINMYRPHQARESVRERLRGMLEDGEEEIRSGEEVQARVRGFLEEVEGLRDQQEQGNAEGGVNGGVNGHGEEENEQVKEARRLWGLVHEIAGE
jgi:mediator of RNA polymerase II transcription subunit 7